MNPSDLMTNVARLCQILLRDIRSVCWDLGILLRHSSEFLSDLRDNVVRLCQLLSDIFVLSCLRT